MAKCTKCGKNILFGKLTSEGLCPSCAQQKIDELQKQVNDLSTPAYQDQQRLQEVNRKISEDNKKIDLQVRQQQAELRRLTSEIKKKQDEIVVLDENILLQEFGLYTPIYDFASSAISIHAPA